MKATKFYQYIVYSDGTIKNLNGHVLKPRVRDDGHLELSLMLNGKKTQMEVQAVVLAAFTNYKADNGKYVIRHLDNNPRNNSLSNLKVGTRAENIKDGESIKDA